MDRTKNVTYLASKRKSNRSVINDAERVAGSLAGSRGRTYLEILENFKLNRATWPISQSLCQWSATQWIAINCRFRQPERKFFLRLHNLAN